MINRIYYGLKPILPARLRLAMRRLRAERVRRIDSPIWPIYEPSGKAPEGWPGWPENKQFAFVLSHDVEGVRGLNRCRQVAEIEMEYGFRSVFNFIPRGGYEVPADLLAWLRKNGFEIGVHDLFHDGSLFRSQEAFTKHAEAINRQLVKWGAVGFRAGFMFHELDWLHALNVDYDASTFDVDPFEPQPDGVHTVFPFWVPRPDPEEDALPKQRGDAANAKQLAKASPADQAGYMELPYTLIQDYNLFIVLQERGIQTWSEKLQWLAEKGAMALLNTHPDYMALEDPTGPYEYSVNLYRKFLQHVQSSYSNRYWHALPKDVAAYCRPLKLAKARLPRQVAMLTHSFYDGDNRVRRYAETLVKRGDEVRVFCLGKGQEVGTGCWSTLNGVKFLCIQSRENFEAGKWEHAWRLLQFLIRAYSALNRKNLPQGCDLLHVHNIPDFLIFAGARLKYRGAKLILDIHDIVPELYESKFGTRKNSALVAALRSIETWSCRFADHVIVANHLWKDTLRTRSLPRGNLTALVNNVDLDVFAPKERVRSGDGPVIIYPGSLNPHQGLDLVIKAVRELVDELPGIKLHIHGRGPALIELKELTRSLQLEDRVLFLPGVPLHEVSGLLAGADIGVVPKRAEGFGDQAYSTKIMEMMSQKLPVIVSRTRIDSLYFDDSVVAFFESGNYQDLAAKIRKVALDRNYSQALVTKAYNYVQANSWETVKHVYLNLVDRLTLTSTNYPLDFESQSPSPPVSMPLELAGGVAPSGQ